MKFLNWILDRTKERSTWLGLTAVLTSVGLALTPEQAEAIVIAGTSIGGLILAFTKDKTPGA